ncbi:peptidylprolyl isomerase [Acanthopleuribacter pedis]|uniref:Peptidylprolyl isomerase n=1 Tax=Acanthopleuribacter pedis TaxID=442870 RepID=A0A8J7QDV7_9BACT|nr:peptidylprolyl isomerase [Acanthopleuribacter pedis]MBO1322009.1 peptidylprolyl isomerase [Acanthopleuribacter pedis]
MTFLFCLMLFTWQDDSPIHFVDRIALKVNDKIITQRELVAMYQQRRQGYMEAFRGAELDEKLKSCWDDTLKEAQEQLLLYENAVQEGVSLSEEDVRTRLNAMRESNGFTDEEFEKIIQEQVGMALPEFIKYRQRVDSSDQVIQARILSRIKIEESDIAKYYSENRTQYMTPATYRIAEIALLKGEGDPLAAKIKANSAADFLKKGGDFTEAAQMYSDSPSKENGGDLGTVEFGDLNASIEDRVKAMEPGGVSEIFETPTAFFIIKLLERTPPRPKPIQDVRPEIVRKLRAPRMEAQMKSYITELKEKYLLQVILKKPPKYLDLDEKI